jgi:hypothetical protein
MTYCFDFSGMFLFLPGWGQSLPAPAAALSAMV